jgi:hypothetical protein
VRAYIELNRANIPPANLAKVENGLRNRTGIGKAIENWPNYLTGTSLNLTSQAYRDYNMFREYRNALVHAKITDVLPSVGKMAQEFETVDYADLANQTASDMIKMVADHFGLDAPNWI